MGRRRAAASVDAPPPASVVLAYGLRTITARDRTPAGSRGPPARPGPAEPARAGLCSPTMEAPAERLASFMNSLEVPARRVGPAEWGLALDAAGYPLDLGVSIRGSLLRAQAAVLPPGLIDPHQLLYWNRQAPLVCFAENRAGEVFVCGELPAESLDADTLDRFLGLLLASATRAREFAVQNAGRVGGHPAAGTEPED